MLPWLQEERRRNPRGIAEFLYDCEHCMRHVHPEQRVEMGCGYLPAGDRRYVAAWDGTSLGRSADRDELGVDGRDAVPVCAGYACGLPEVVEVSNAHLFLKNGGLSQFCDGTPTPALRDAVTLLECEHGRVLDWTSKNPPSKES